MGLEPEEGVTYPREVAVKTGMPDGWHGIERQYGPNSKTAGQVYCRYYSNDGRHNHFCSPKQVINTHCEDTGEDPVEMLASYNRLTKGAKDNEKSKRAEVKGSKTENREEAVNRFRDTFGKLEGPIVFMLPGWITRWHHQPACNQVMVEYLDTDGNSWKLLKDLECSFQFKIDNGQGDGIPEMIKQAKALADPAKFAEGAKTARSTGGTAEMRGDRGESTLHEAGARGSMRKERLESRHGLEGPTKKARSSAIRPVHFAVDAVEQTGWAAIEGKEDVQQAFQQFQRLLAQRGFHSNLELLAICGVSPERKFARRMCGVYYQMPEPFGGSRCYQKLLRCPNAREELGCDGLFFVYSQALSRWELTTQLKEVRAVVAHSCDAKGPLVQAKGPWHVQDGSGDLFYEEQLAVLTPTAGIGSAPAGTAVNDAE